MNGARGIPSEVLRAIRMGLQSILGAVDISASGLAAERLRMEVVAENLANAHTTRTAEGGPYRRRDVIFSAAYDQAARASDRSSGQGLGVEVVGVEPDMGDLPEIYQPGHPDADDKGFVRMPNVQPAREMVDLISASRGYEANLRVLRTFKEMAEQALSVLRET
jgi:flagellar basal-body rod protein FlgC